MSARIGDRQLELVVVLGTPGCALVVGSKVSAALVKRGLLQDDGSGHMACITPAGLRALADEMERGRVHSALERMRADVARRKAATKREGTAA